MNGNYHDYWHWPTEDPRWSVTSTFWASYQQLDPTKGSISGLFFINSATGIATNLTPYEWYTDNETNWWNQPSD